MADIQTKEPFLQTAKDIESKLVRFHNGLNAAIQDYILSGDSNPKTNKDFDNIRNARDWTEESIRKLQLAIRNLENKNGYANFINKGD